MKWPLNQIVMALNTTLTATFRRSHLRWFVGLSLPLLCVALIISWVVKRRVEREFDLARAQQERQAFVPFERERRQALAGDGIELIQSARHTRSLAQFNNSIFAATDGGLVEFSEDGTVVRRYTTLDGLPESDLTELASFGSKLFIGSRSQGLIVFDGKGFERYRWTDRNAQAISAMLEDHGRLLIGTFAGGLLEFDGKDFKEVKAEADQKRLAGINCLVADGSRLFVGTFADGLWINEAGRWSRFTIADGLPSNRIVGLVPNAGLLIVASDFGVATAAINQLLSNSDISSQKRFQLIATLPELASAVRYDSGVLLCKDNGEMYRLIADARTSNRVRFDPIVWNRPASLSSCQLTAFAHRNQQPGEALWLTSSEGIWRIGWQDGRLAGRFNFTAFGKMQQPDALSSNLISALAFDDLGRLWAGSFRNGIDVISLEGRRAAHLESESVREINALVWDDRSNRMVAATARGLIRFDDSFASVRLSASDGLLGNSISHAALIHNRLMPNRTSLALATSRGLSLGESKQWKGLTTVQGLPSNSVYAVLAQREFIYAGTLSGLAQIAQGRVVRIFKDSNSKLSHNWVTALCAAGGRLFVGTYGGGVFELTPAGEFGSFASEIGKQVVNPNAMTSDGEFLYVGTLDGAWAMDMRSQEWIHLKSELPSPTVLSVAGDGRYVYFGSTNGIARIEVAFLRRRAGKA
jgi:ligand-binding sensor domain-containing protein